MCNVIGFLIGKPFRIYRPDFRWMEPAAAGGAYQTDFVIRWSGVNPGAIKG